MAAPGQLAANIGAAAIAVVNGSLMFGKWFDMLEAKKSGSGRKAGAGNYTEADDALVLLDFVIALWEAMKPPLSPSQPRMRQMDPFLYFMMQKDKAEQEERRELRAQERAQKREEREERKRKERKEDEQREERRRKERIADEEREERKRKAEDELWLRRKREDEAEEVRRSERKLQIEERLHALRAAMMQPRDSR